MASSSKRTGDVKWWERLTDGNPYAEHAVTPADKLEVEENKSKPRKADNPFVKPITLSGELWHTVKQLQHCEGRESDLDYDFASLKVVGDEEAKAKEAGATHLTLPSKAPESSLQALLSPRYDDCFHWSEERKTARTPRDRKTKVGPPGEAWAKRALHSMTKSKKRRLEQHLTESWQGTNFFKWKRGGRTVKTGAKTKAKEEVVPDGNLDQVSRIHGFLSQQNVHELLKKTGYSRRELYIMWVQLFDNANVLGGQTFKRGVARLSVEDDLFVDRVFGLVDEDNSGQIEWDEFLIAMSALEKGVPEVKTRFFFQIYDLDEDGFIGKEDLSRLFLSSSMLRADQTTQQVVDAFVDRTFRLLGCEEEGKISMKDIETFMDKHGHYYEDIWDFFGRSMLKDFTQDEEVDPLRATKRAGLEDRTITSSREREERKRKETEQAQKRALLEKQP